MYIFRFRRSLARSGHRDRARAPVRLFSLSLSSFSLSLFFFTLSSSTSRASGTEKEHERTNELLFVILQDVYFREFWLLDFSEKGEVSESFGRPVANAVSMSHYRRCCIGGIGRYTLIVCQRSQFTNILTSFDEIPAVKSLYIVLI